MFFLSKQRRSTFSFLPKNSDSHTVFVFFFCFLGVFLVHVIIKKLLFLSTCIGKNESLQQPKTFVGMTISIVAIEGVFRVEIITSSPPVCSEVH